MDLVATKVDDAGIREETGDLRKNVAKEGKGLGTGRIEGEVGPGVALLAREAPAAVFGVGDVRRICVAGHVDLGHNRDVSRASVGHDVADLFLRVELPWCIGGAVGLRAAGAYLGESGVFLDFDTPAGGVGQVPVQAIELVMRHCVEQAFERFDSGEMPTLVEHVAPPTEAWGIADHHTGKGEGGLALLCPGQELRQGLQAIEVSGGSGGVNDDRRGQDAHHVAFAFRFGEILRSEVGRQELHRTGDVCRRHTNGEPGRLRQCIGVELCSHHGHMGPRTALQGIGSALCWLQ